MISDSDKTLFYLLVKSRYDLGVFHDVNSRLRYSIWCNDEIFTLTVVDSNQDARNLRSVKDIGYFDSFAEAENVMIEDWLERREK